jgi:hypothetical protein
MLAKGQKNSKTKETGLIGIRQAILKSFIKYFW